MSMANPEIIAKAAMLAGITEEAHTFAHWKQLGFCVRKGEHAAFSTSIWKRGADKKDKHGKLIAGKFFLAKAFFFTASQVEYVNYGEAVSLFDEAGNKLEALVKRAANGFTIRFPAQDELCYCDTLEAVQREIMDYCAYAGLTLGGDEV